MRGDRLMINGSGGGEAFGPGAILALFRQGQARTRADLVRLTGLARSTITQRLDALFAADLLVRWRERVNWRATTNAVQIQCIRRSPAPRRYWCEPPALCGH